MKFLHGECCFTYALPSYDYIRLSRLISKPHFQRLKPYIKQCESKEFPLEICEISHSLDSDVSLFCCILTTVNFEIRIIILNRSNCKSQKSIKYLSFLKVILVQRCMVSIKLCCDYYNFILTFFSKVRFQQAITEDKLRLINLPSSKTFLCDDRLFPVVFTFSLIQSQPRKNHTRDEALTSRCRTYFNVLETSREKNDWKLVQTQSTLFTAQVLWLNYYMVYTLWLHGVLNYEKPKTSSSVM